ncbi:PGF-pre-PGF domain-containing protein [Methanococcoides orientis]|uniref:PGF-pre-PGF domain-containing protein n=1 Tax=Methanococcoides orientis TaxID=2822137 RepID=UPI001E5E37EE|nr:PGF-pre-PGF domain-containing protein [Methanococcoides orientis]UGV41745.1 PGF-pre-PGF domain-containing protein [Methanococcoides orientis]
MFTIIFLSGIAVASTTVSIMPISQSVDEGQNFSVGVYLDPDNPVAGVQFDLSYDNELVKVVQVSEGEFLRQEGVLVWFNPGKIESSNGNINSVYGLILDKTSVTEPGYFAIIQMTGGNRSGISSLELSNVVVSDTQGQIIPIDVVDGSVSIGAATASSTRSKTSDKDDPESGIITTTSGSYQEFEMMERSTQAVYLGSQVSYQFDKPENPIIYINYESLTNAGNVIATIEVLNAPSRFVSSDPPGIVYKNVNIWLGKPGYGTEEDIKDAVIGFRVDNSWFEDNRISDNSVMLYRYEQDTWIPLPTTKISETSSYVNFKSKTTEFSPFVIVGDISEEVIAEVAEVDELPEEDNNLDQNVGLILVLSLLALLFARRR